MPIYEAYVQNNFKQASLDVIACAKEVILSYDAQGYDLTLRQLYYQMIAKDLLPDSWIDEKYNRKNGLPLDTKNTEKSYNRLGEILNIARLAGRLPWDVMVDRSRSMKSNQHWDSPQQIMRAAAYGYKKDKWSNQPNRVVVLVEKEALEGIVASVSARLDVPYEACKGYFSQSEMWGLGKKITRWKDAGQRTIILHLGDHDPSGIDMTRDIADRLEMFAGRRVTVDRLALNMEQVEEYNPPPNPAKTTDCRYAGYRDKYGDDSWELDAIEPPALQALVETAIEKYRDPDKWQEALEREQYESRALRAACDNWETVSSFLDDEGLIDAVDAEDSDEDTDDSEE
jgi:hypothetical protein